MTDAKAPSPGEILRLELLNRPDLSVSDFSERVGISCDDINKILNGALAISAEISERFAEYFKCSPKKWLHLQFAHEDAMERHRRQEHAKKFSSEEGLPQWAPWELVYYYYELKHDKAMSLCPIEARQDVQPMLRRLITHADMANVWNALCNKPRSDKYIRLSPDELPSLIFIAIVQAWKSFQNQMRDPQTYAQKKTELLKLAKKTDSLINEIGQSLVAQELSEVVS